MGDSIGSDPKVWDGLQVHPPAWQIDIEKFREQWQQMPVVQEMGDPAALLANIDQRLARIEQMLQPEVSQEAPLQANTAELPTDVAALERLAGVPEGTARLLEMYTAAKNHYMENEEVGFTSDGRCDPGESKRVADDFRCMMHPDLQRYEEFLLLSMCRHQSSRL